jgi:hypothetical protein
MHGQSFSGQLGRETGTAESAHAAIERPFRPGLLGRCANPDCKSGWLQLFRDRSTPVFEDGWTCSPGCTEVRVQYALRREYEGGTPGREEHRHRIPLGLLMLEQGWITREQLKTALEAQRAAGSGRLGDWLIAGHATDEATVTRALGIQWSCPMLALKPGASSALASLMPRLFLDAFGVLPLRVAAGKLLYLGFEQRLDQALAFAVERMTRLRVESGILPSSAFRAEHARMVREEFPPVQLGEALTSAAAAHTLARAIERTRPVASRLVRVHDCIWLRMLLVHETSAVPRLGTVRDFLCSIVAN